MQTSIFSPLLAVSSFFNSVLVITKPNFLRLIIQLIFALIISVIYGFFTTFLFIAVISSFIGFNTNFLGSVLFSGVFLLFFLQVLLIFKYGSESSFNLPKVLLQSFILITHIFEMKALIKVLLYLIITTLAFMFIFIGLLSGIPIPPQFALPVLIAIFISALTLSIVFSYIIKSNTLMKKIKQLVLSFYIASGLVFFTIVRLFFYDYSLSVTIIEIILLLISLIGTVVWFLENTNDTYKCFCDQYNNELDDIWNDLDNRYSYKLSLARLKKEKKELTNGFRLVQTEWKEGKKKTVIIRIALAILMISLTITTLSFIDLLIKESEPVLSNSIELITTKWVSFFDNKQQATAVFMLICATGALLWFLIKLIRILRI